MVLLFLKYVAMAFLAVLAGLGLVGLVVLSMPPAWVDRRRAIPRGRVTKVDAHRAHAEAEAEDSAFRAQLREGRA